VLDHGAPAGRRHFTRNFLQKMALVQCPRAFRPRRLAQSVGRGFGPRHFTGKFLLKVALVKCPSAFGLRGLAQSVVRGFGPRHFTYKFSRKVVLVRGISHFTRKPATFGQSGFCDMSKCISIACAGSRQVWSAVWSAAFYL